MKSTKRIKFGFCVYGEYQLFNVINFVSNDIEQSKKDSDLYLVGTKMQSYYDRIKRINIFNDVYLVDDVDLHEEPKLNRIVKKARFILFKRLYKELLHTTKRNEYEILVVPDNNFNFELFLKFFKHSKLYYIDDGTGSYYGDIRKRTTNKTHHYLNIALNRYEQVEKLYLNNTRICSSKICSNYCELPAIQDLAIYKSVFSYNQNAKMQYKECRFIVLDNVVFGVSQTSVSLLSQYMDLIQNYVGDTIGVRLHPRNIGEVYKNDSFRYLDPDPMWEVLCGDGLQKDIVLIVWSSTASITPKLLYNLEPYLILLYKLVPINQPGTEEIEKLFELVKDEYKTDRVFIPNTKEELIQVLQRVIKY